MQNFLDEALLSGDSDIKTNSIGPTGRLQNRGKADDLWHSATLEIWFAPFSPCCHSLDKFIGGEACNEGGIDLRAAILTA